MSGLFTPVTDQPDTGQCVALVLRFNEVSVVCRATVCMHTRAHTALPAWHAHAFICGAVTCTALSIVTNARLCTGPQAVWGDSDSPGIGVCGRDEGMLSCCHNTSSSTVIQLTREYTIHCALVMKLWDQGKFEELCIETVQRAECIDHLWTHPHRALADCSVGGVHKLTHRPPPPLRVTHRRGGVQTPPPKGDRFARGGSRPLPPKGGASSWGVRELPNSVLEGTGVV